MPLFGELFLSEIIGHPVLDPAGDELGVLRDVCIVKGDPLPKIDGIVVESRKKKYLLDWSQMNLFNKRMLSSFTRYKELKEAEGLDELLLARRDILDKQIVDANGVKVVRANDIKFEGYASDALLVAIDVGMRGILRRMGYERQGERVFKLFNAELAHHLISWDFMQPLDPKVSTIGLTVPRQMVEELHPADLADLISQVSQEEGVTFIENLDVETAAEALSELEPSTLSAMISDMNAEHAANIIEEMSPDSAADLLNSLPPEKAKEILEKVEQEEAEDIQELLSHESDTAGGLMTNEFLHYPPDMTIDEMLERFRVESPELEYVYYIYIIDEEEKLLGVVSLKDVLLSDRSNTLGNIMETNLKTIRPDANELEAAQIINKYDLVALPVVDCDTCMLGIITVDDILDRMLPRHPHRKRRML